MRLTQGTFSYLPDLSDEQIISQLNYCLDQGWAVNIEYTDDPHPRNTYWELWGLPMFDVSDPKMIMQELKTCCAQYANHYIRVTAFDSQKGWESIRLSFIVNRPEQEPGFRVVRQESEGRRVRYSIESYAVNRAPKGQRY